VPTGREVTGRGFRKLAAGSPPDATRGKALHMARCAMCQSADGQGVKAGGGCAMPPLWGPAFFSTGAGMARIDTAAAYVQTKMPLNTSGTLSSQDAFDIAAFFTAQARPAFRVPPR
jgi:thiosulfate dehydrogenase